MVYWGYESDRWEEAAMADVYKQSFKQSDTNHIELTIFNCGLERCAPGQTWGPGSRRQTIRRMFHALTEKPAA